MAAPSGCSASVPSLPPPCPKSPPQYPDLYGKRRETARVQMLEREIGFLEEELKSVERLQPSSRCCKEVADFVAANPDPLIPTNRKKRRSCRFWKWLCRMPCFSCSWICCCCCNRCSLHLEMPRCCDCGQCNCNPCACCCPLPKWRCGCSCPQSGCSCLRSSCSCPRSSCCKNISCSKNCCILPSCSCPDCSCSNCFKWKCSCPKCPKLRPCCCCRISCCCNPCNICL